MKLKSKTSYISSVPDGQPKKRLGPKVFRYFYFSGLILLASYIIYYLILHYFIYVYGTGIVQHELMYVQAKYPCEIMEYMVDENDKVYKGTPLIEIKYLPAKIFPGKQLGMNIRKIKVLEDELKEKKKELQEKVLFKSLRKLKEEDYTVLSPDRESYAETKDELEELKRKIQLLKSEMPELPGTNIQNYEDIDSVEDIEHKNIIKSKFKGRVLSKTKKKYELVESGENLMLLEDLNELRIYATFLKSHLTYLRQGQKVHIEFSNGKISTGKIHRIYTSKSFRTSSNYINKSEIEVEIVPNNESQLNTWKQFQGIKVDVRVKR